MILEQVIRAYHYE